MASPNNQRTHTPLQTTGIALPPAKRQKLSPVPSPLSGGHYGQTYHNQPYQSHPGGPPYVPSPTVPYISLPHENHVYSFNQPQPIQMPYNEGPPRPAAGTMGPPEKPKAEKATDINDLNDMVTASGIDLREEENYLAATYRNRHQETSFSVSFGNSQSSSTVSANNSFQQWSQGSYGTQPGFQSHGPLSQPAVSQKSVEEELREKHRLSVRLFSERKQQHLNDPFLLTQSVRDKLSQKTMEYQVRLDPRGYHEGSPKPPPQNPQGVSATTMVGANGTGVIVAKANGTLDKDAPLVDLLSLLSLAANERLRSLLEDAYAISRARQFGSQGVVPPEWAGIAQGNGTPQETTARSHSISHTAWDQAPDSAVSPMTVLPPKLDPNEPKRLPTPPTEPELPPRPTIAFSSPIPTVLQKIANADKEAEKKRLERRKKREKERQNSVLSETVSPATATPTATPATPGAEAVPGIPKMTKKQLAKEKTQASTDEFQRKQANATANMALGGMSKKYSWMTAAAPAPATGLQAGVGLGRGGPPASRTGSLSGAPAAPQEDAGLRAKEYWKKLGDWREDGPGGKGVQIRDWITVLERDGVEKKTLAKCYARLSSGDKER